MFWIWISFPTISDGAHLSNFGGFKFFRGCRLRFKETTNIFWGITDFQGYGWLNFLRPLSLIWQIYSEIHCGVNISLLEMVIHKNLFKIVSCRQECERVLSSLKFLMSPIAIFIQRVSRKIKIWKYLFILFM